MSHGRRISITAYAVSALFHIALVFLAPGLGELTPRVKPRWVEVDLYELPEPPPVEEPRFEPRRGGESPSSAQDSEMPLGESQVFPAPPVWLPDRMAPLDAEPPSTGEEIPSTLSTEIAGKGRGLIGDLDFDRPDSIATKRRIEGAPPDMEWEPENVQPSLSRTEDREVFPIEGPVAKRRIIYRPPAPRPETNVAGTVQLKFWVKPNGTIGKIIPIVRADPALEKASIEFLEKWRFEPAQSERGEEWGVLSIRFKLN